MTDGVDFRPPSAYEQMSRELAPYQGRPHPEARPVGDPAAGTGAPPVSDPDAARAEEVAHAYRKIGASSLAAPELTSDVARAQVGQSPNQLAAERARAAEGLAEDAPMPLPEGIIPRTTALAESTPEAGGVLVPPQYAARRRR